jgi:D-alanyl-D-alanine carboxypeptidase
MTRSILAALLAASCTAYADPLSRCVEARAAREDFSGAVVALHRGAVAVSVARGVVGAPGSAAITPATRFNIASAGKMFTAVAVAQLVDAGKIAFDDPVGKHVAGLAPETAAITLRQLLTHTSGLGDFFSPQNIPALHRARTAGDLLPLVAAQKPDFAPGSQFKYSNSGFVLLGVVIERVSGMTYGEYLRSHVFTVAGMTSSGLDPEPLDTLAQGLTARSPAGGAGPLHPSPAAMLHGNPAGGAFSSAGDLQKFAAALAGNRLASARTTAMLLAPQVKTPSPDRSHGLGFGIKSRHERTWMGHNGGTLGVNVELEFSADGEWSLAVLSNRDPPAATTMLEYLEELIAKPADARECKAADR